MKLSRIFKWKSSSPDPTDGESRPKHIVSAIYGEAAARRYMDAADDHEREVAERSFRGEVLLADYFDRQRRGKAFSPPLPDPRLDPRQHVAQAIMSNPPNLSVSQPPADQESEEAQVSTDSSASSFSRYTGPWVRSDGSLADISPVRATSEELRRIEELCAELPTPYYSVTHASPSSAVKRKPVPLNQGTACDITDQRRSPFKLLSPLETLPSPVPSPYSSSASAGQSIVDCLEQATGMSIAYADWEDAAANEFRSPKYDGNPRCRETPFWRTASADWEDAAANSLRSPQYDNTSRRQQNPFLLLSSTWDSEPLECETRDGTWVPAETLGDGGSQSASSSLQGRRKDKGKTWKPPTLRRSDAIKRKPGAMWLEPHWHSPTLPSEQAHSEGSVKTEASPGPQRSNAIRWKPSASKLELPV